MDGTMADRRGLGYGDLDVKKSSQDLLASLVRAAEEQPFGTSMQQCR